jgi:hypothetical protein
MDAYVYNNNMIMKMKNTSQKVLQRKKKKKTENYGGDRPIDQSLEGHVRKNLPAANISIDTAKSSAPAPNAMIKPLNLSLTCVD